MNEAKSPSIPVATSVLDDAIALLEGVENGLGLTDKEQRRLRQLNAAARLAVASTAIVLLLALLSALGSTFGWRFHPDSWAFWPAVGLSFIAAIGFFISASTGLLVFVLSGNVVHRIDRETARLKALGVNLGPLAGEAIKKKSRRRWTARRVTYLAAGVTLSLIAFAGATSGQSTLSFLVFQAGGAVLVIAGLLPTADEVFALAASAKALKRELAGMRASVAGDIASVPIALLEKASQIETAKIAHERGAAVLQSVAAGNVGFAIRFSAEAARDRAALSIAERVVLEDLLAEISARGPAANAAVMQVDGPAGHHGTLVTERGSLRVRFDPEAQTRALSVSAIERIATAGANFAGALQSDHG